MASGPITSWKIKKGNSGNSDIFSFLGLQNHCRQWIQPWKQKTLTPWKGSYHKSRQHIHIQKQRHHFATVKVMVFSIVTYRCAIWTIKKDERQRIDAFKLWCWKRLENFLDCKKIKSVSPKGKVKFTQLFPILWDPMDCSPPGSSDHGILQARILEWVALPLSRRSSWIWVSCIADEFLPSQPAGKPS